MSWSTRKTVQIAINMLTSEILSQNQLLQESLNEIDSFGITDAKQIINEYLEEDELGLAFDHLNYVISEIGIDLSFDQKSRIIKVSEKLNTQHIWLTTPPETEISAFYKLTDSFNQCQRKVTQILQDLWNLKFPLTNMDWLGWHYMARESDVSFEQGEVKIFPHGYGLSMITPEFFIDFDFGDAGEIDGFDAGRLLVYNEKNKITDLLKTFDQIQNVLDHEIKNGKVKDSGYVNYYKI